jgi:beta-phosphoglucomutase
MIRGVLFDMDGVLVDSESFMCKAAIMMFSELGINILPEEFQPFSRLSPLPGAHKFVLKCRNKGLKLALATSADTVKMEVNLKEIGLSGDSFHSIITGLDVKKKKPFPDIYLRASDTLGLKPGDCLVIEDAVSGIEAGKAAGCRCLAITTSVDAIALKEADWICDSLLNVPDEVLNW